MPLGLGSLPEVIAAGGALLQVRGEKRLGKRALHGVEESGLRLRLDGVDGAEGKTQETVI